MAVVSGGEVLQTGPPLEVFSRPRNAEVALVVGVETVVKGRVVWAAAGMSRVEVNGVVVNAIEGDACGPDVYVCIRAEDIALERGPLSVSSARNQLAGTVTAVVMLGALARVTLNCGFQLVAMVTRSSVEDLQLIPGQSVLAVIKAGAVHLVSRQDL